MDILVLIGRILFVVLFLASGFGHLTQARGMAGYAQSKGVPSPLAAVYGSGVLLVIGALMVVLGVWIDIGALLLLVFLLPTIVLMHAFWKETDANAKQQEMIQFNKDLALAGACLMLFAFSAHLGSDLGLTLTEPLVDLG